MKGGLRKLAATGSRDKIDVADIPSSTSDLMVPALILIGALVFTGGIIYVANLQKKRRTQEMSVLASQMGWTFEEEPAVPAELRELEPFRTGHSHRMRNRLTRRRQEQTVEAFDYFYTTGGGKNAHHHRMTVVKVPLPETYPVFSVRGEHFGHRIAGIFGMQDIDFPEYPAFSQRYLLRGADEPAIRRAFSRDLIEFFEAHTEDAIAAACGGRDLYVWMNGLTQPAAMEMRLEMALELRRRLTNEER
jgi:hypothetical protein